MRRRRSYAEDGAWGQELGGENSFTAGLPYPPAKHMLYYYITQLPYLSPVLFLQWKSV
jgi:hypothetical protein